MNKEEYKKFVSELVEQDKDNKNLKCLRKGYVGWAVFVVILSPMIICASFPVIFVVNVLLGLLLISLGIIGIVFSIVRLVRRAKAVSYYEDNYREKVIGYLLSGYKYYFNSDAYINENIFDDSQFGSSTDFS